jgi:hypothetical protein
MRKKDEILLLKGNATNLELQNDIRDVANYKR